MVFPFPTYPVSKLKWYMIVCGIVNSGIPLYCCYLEYTAIMIVQAQHESICTQAREISRETHIFLMLMGSVIIPNLVFGFTIIVDFQNCNRPFGILYHLTAGIICWKASEVLVEGLTYCGNKAQDEFHKAAMTAVVASKIHFFFIILVFIQLPEGESIHLPHRCRKILGLTMLDLPAPPRRIVVQPRRIIREVTVIPAEQPAFIYIPLKPRLPVASQIAPASTILSVSQAPPISRAPSILLASQAPRPACSSPSLVNPRAPLTSAPSVKPSASLTSLPSVTPRGAPTSLPLVTREPSTSTCVPR